jgi:hypothetical protein
MEVGEEQTKQKNKTTRMQNGGGQGAKGANKAKK